MNKSGLTFVCLIISMSVLSSCRASPLVRRTEGENSEKCKDICKECSCLGFYCGDECICECNNTDDENLNCVESMQNNCEKFNLPFEVLIQGPSGNRFVRSLLAAEENINKSTAEPVDPKARSTIIVYQPNENAERNADSKPETIPEEPIAEKQDVDVITSEAKTTDETETKESKNVQIKREIAYDADTARQRELMKRQTEDEDFEDSESEEDVAEAAALVSDAAAINENTNPDAINSESGAVSSTTEPEVGSALLAPKLLGIKNMLNLKAIALANKIKVAKAVKLAPIRAKAALLKGKLAALVPGIPLLPVI